MNDSRKNLRLFVKIIVAVLGFIIFLIWSFNLKNVWLISKSSKNQEFSDVKNNFSEAMVDLKDKINLVKTDNAKKEKIKAELFIKELLKETENIGSSTLEEAKNDNSTSSVQLKPSNQNCPQYINCMPTIGEARNCNVPLGCEGLTTLLY